MFENHFENELYEQVNDSLYALNFEKKKKDVKKNGLVQLTSIMVIHHKRFILMKASINFVQILFILKELLMKIGGCFLQKWFDVNDKNK